jgi:hypothetical protein
MAFFYTGRMEEALSEEKKALAMEPENQRFQGNTALLEKKIRESAR